VVTECLQSRRLNIAKPFIILMVLCFTALIVGAPP
jgi:hypothetical protein